MNIIKKVYHVEPLDTGFFSGNLDPKKLNKQLNEFGAKGWAFVRSIQETRPTMLFFKREVHFLVFVKDEMSTL